MLRTNLKKNLEDKYVVSTLYAFCKPFFNDRINPNIQLKPINKMITFLNLFKDFNTNKEEIKKIKSSFTEDNSKKNDGSVLKHIIAINTLIISLEKEDERALEFKKGISLILDLLIARQLIIKGRSKNIVPDDTKEPEKINHSTRERGDEKILSGKKRDRNKFFSSGIIIKPTKDVLSSKKSRVSLETKEEEQGSNLKPVLGVLNQI